MGSFLGCLTFESTQAKAKFALMWARVTFAALVVGLVVAGSVFFSSGFTKEDLAKLLSKANAKKFLPVPRPCSNSFFDCVNQKISPRLLAPPNSSVTSNRSLHVDFILQKYRDVLRETASCSNSGSVALAFERPGVGGLGNRFWGASTVFLLSLLTHRRFPLMSSSSFLQSFLKEQTRQVS